MWGCGNAVFVGCNVVWRPWLLAGKVFLIGRQSIDDAMRSQHIEVNAMFRNCSLCSVACSERDAS